MKVVILAGGFGTRLAEETHRIPKPIIEIGGKPILWHIMKHYSFYGFKEFIIAAGYKGEIIKRYFKEYHELNSDITVNLREGRIELMNSNAEDWIIHIVDTGLNTLTGGRIKRLEKLLKHGTFTVTYGDGLSDVNLKKLLAFHKSYGKIATVTAVRPPSRFGEIIFKGDVEVKFVEKPQTLVSEGWINGGYMVFEPEVFNYIEGDDISLEVHVLERLSRENQLVAYKHEGFWHCIDTLRDLRLAQSLWEGGNPPWKIWDK